MVLVAGINHTLLPPGDSPKVLSCPLSPNLSQLGSRQDYPFVHGDNRRPPITKSGPRPGQSSGPDLRGLGSKFVPARHFAIKVRAARDISDGDQSFSSRAPT